MGSRSRQLHLNAFLMSSGHHEAAWRLPQSNPFANTDLEHWRHLAQVAEKAAFDSVFLADGPESAGMSIRRPSPSCAPRCWHRIAVVAGNPKPASRTLAAAVAVADALAEAITVPADHLVVDLAEHAASLFDAAAPELSLLTAEVADAGLAVFASPTYKASYTGMLKAFLDRYGSNGLAGSVAVPLMTGGWAGHLRAGTRRRRPGGGPVGRRRRSADPGRAGAIRESLTTPEFRGDGFAVARVIRG